jgi:hypothetical protein
MGSQGSKLNVKDILKVTSSDLEKLSQSASVRTPWIGRSLFSDLTLVQYDLGSTNVLMSFTLRNIEKTSGVNTWVRQ